MSVFNELWKIASAAWSQLARSLTCLFLNARLLVLNAQIDGAKAYIAAVNDNSTSLTKSIARYFEEQIPIWTAERESLEAQLEINGCKED
jgi:hypothetical protein